MVTDQTQDEEGGGDGDKQQTIWYLPIGISMEKKFDTDQEDTFSKLLEHIAEQYPLN